MDIHGFFKLSKTVAKLLGSTAAIITGLSQVSNSRPDTQLTLRGIVTQVQTLHTAISQIGDLCKVEMTCEQSDLAEAFETVLSYCDLLVERLDQDVATLCADGNTSAAMFMFRLKTAFNDGPANELQLLIDRQISALTLLLNIHSCKSVSTQATLLEMPAHRQILCDAKSDSLSLKVNCDSDSTISQSTDQLSLLSREFTFDESLFSSKVYSDNSVLLIRLLQRRIHEGVLDESAAINESNCIPRHSQIASYIQPAIVVIQQLPVIMNSSFLFSMSPTDGKDKCYSRLAFTNRRCRHLSRKHKSIMGQQRAEEIRQYLLAVDDQQSLEEELIRRMHEFIALNCCAIHYQKSISRFQQWCASST